MKSPHTAKPQNKKALVLEDDQILRDLIVNILEIMEFEKISSVSSLTEALNLVEGIKAKEDEYDLYVSDCNLGEPEGEKNGRHFLEEIALKAPHSARLFISGAPDNFIGFEGETFAKPFTAAGLIGAINRALAASGRTPFNLS